MSALKLVPYANPKGLLAVKAEAQQGGEEVLVQSKTVTPTTSSQVILPDAEYDYLSQVTVEAIPYAETENSYGITVTIG